MIASKGSIAEFRQRLMARAIIQQFRDARPADKYSPHDKGQVQFHRAAHTVRGIFPGNGWGKTTAMAAEADAWCRHTCRWQPTPAWSIIVVWFCPQYSQFGMLREQLETDIIGRNIPWRDTPDGKFYEYPDGSRWYVASADRKWKFLQGINPDLVIFDEMPPGPLWREMMVRRRGSRKTRFVVGATATEGITHIADAVYKPWKEFHADAGLDEEAAMIEQIHAYIWCWARGGIHDNPGADQSDIEWYEQTEWTSEKEKKVRLYGGFEDWTGDAVFSGSAVERMREEIEAWEAANPGWPLSGMIEPVFRGQ